MSQPAHICMKVTNRADEYRPVTLMADARQQPGVVDLMTMGRDYTGSHRTWLVRMSPDEAEQYATNIMAMVELVRARDASQPTGQGGE